MKNKDIMILEKILKYISEIRIFIMDYSYEDFISDRKTINACVFDLGQIGELAGKISEDMQKEYTNIEWRGIKALRNRIVHDYDGVNLNMIWEFLTTELNDLEEQLKEITYNK